MYQQVERLQFLLSRCLMSCSASGSSNQYMKIDNLPRVMGEGAKIEVNQISVIVNQLRADLGEAKKITDDLAFLIPGKGLTIGQATARFQENVAMQALNRARGNITKGAKMLGMKRGIFSYYCKRFIKEKEK